MSNYRSYAEREFKAAGWVDSEGNWKDDMQKAICEGVLDLLEVLSKQGHSGTTAPYTVDMFEKLASFEPLTPLTGADDEWDKVDDGLFQNKRCSHVFADNECAYDIEGKVFVEKNGTAYTSFDSRVPVTFPYTPKKERVYV